MNPEVLARALHASIVEENSGIYRDIFENTPANQASDPYWRQALMLFANLSEQQRAVLFLIIRQTAVDTVSNLLGVLDGVNSLDNISGSFDLIHDGARLNGDLQSLFLVEEEQHSI